uniref:uncharacterized protein si:ch211-159e12.5 isoform X2 n=1 Tax=Doryrhamphus excisus TaxID=161450 RepID=UPI0025AE22EA|nr:uncharacterized protein si:ch211-159e12.5 isoform X2 [Doryrhamphus excisus]
MDLWPKNQGLLPPYMRYGTVPGRSQTFNYHDRNPVIHYPSSNHDDQRNHVRESSHWSLPRSGTAGSRLDYTKWTDPQLFTPTSSSQLPFVLDYRSQQNLADYEPSEVRECVTGDYGRSYQRRWEASKRELEAWAARYSHSLPRRRRIETEQRGASQGLLERRRTRIDSCMVAQQQIGQCTNTREDPAHWEIASPEAPNPSYGMDVKGRIGLGMFSQPPDYIAPPPYDTPRKRSSVTPHSDINRIQVERTREKPDRNQKTDVEEFPKQRSRVNNADIPQERFPQPGESSSKVIEGRKFRLSKKTGGMTIFCLVSRIAGPTEHGSFTPSANTKIGNSSTDNPTSKVADEVDKTTKTKQMEPSSKKSVAPEEKLTEEFKTNDAKLAPPARYPLWKEPSFTRNPLGMEVRRLDVKKGSESKEGEDLLVIDTTCVVVKMELIQSPKKEHVHLLDSRSSPVQSEDLLKQDRDPDPVNHIPNNRSLKDQMDSDPVILEIDSENPKDLELDPNTEVNHIPNNRSFKDKMDSDLLTLEIDGENLEDLDPDPNTEVNHIPNNRSLKDKMDSDLVTLEIDSENPKDLNPIPNTEVNHIPNNRSLKDKMDSDLVTLEIDGENPKDLDPNPNTEVNHILNNRSLKDKMDSDLVTLEIDGENPKDLNPIPNTEVNHIPNNTSLKDKMDSDLLTLEIDGENPKDLDPDPNTEVNHIPNNGSLKDKMDSDLVTLEVHGENPKDLDPDPNTEVNHIPNNRSLKDKMDSDLLILEIDGENPKDLDPDPNTEVNHIPNNRSLKDQMDSDLVTLEIDSENPKDLDPNPNTEVNHIPNNRSLKDKMDSDLLTLEIDGENPKDLDPDPNTEVNHILNNRSLKDKMDSDLLTLEIDGENPKDLDPDPKMEVNHIPNNRSLKDKMDSDLLTLEIDSENPKDLDPDPNTEVNHIPNNRSLKDKMDSDLVTLEIDGQNLEDLDPDPNTEVNHIPNNRSLKDKMDSGLLTFEINGENPKESLENQAERSSCLDRFLKMELDSSPDHHHEMKEKLYQDPTKEEEHSQNQQDPNKDKMSDDWVEDVLGSQQLTNGQPGPDDYQQVETSENVPVGLEDGRDEGQPGTPPPLQLNPPLPPSSPDVGESNPTFISSLESLPSISESGTEEGPDAEWGTLDPVEDGVLQPGTASSLTSLIPSATASESDTDVSEEVHQESPTDGTSEEPFEGDHVQMVSDISIEPVEQMPAITKEEPSDFNMEHQELCTQAEDNTTEEQITWLEVQTEENLDVKESLEDDKDLPSLEEPMVECQSAKEDTKAVFKLPSPPSPSDFKVEHQELLCTQAEDNNTEEKITSLEVQTEENLDVKESLEDDKDLPSLEEPMVELLFPPSPSEINHEAQPRGPSPPLDSREDLAPHEETGSTLTAPLLLMEFIPSSESSPPPAGNCVPPDVPQGEVLHYTNPLWDAVNRIRKHTAPDSENEEEEVAEFWDPRSVEGVRDIFEELDVSEDMEVGEMLRHPWCEEDTFSCSSTSSHDSGDTVVVAEEFQEVQEAQEVQEEQMEEVGRGCLDEMSNANTHEQDGGEDEEDEYQTGTMDKVMM